MKNKNTITVLILIIIAFAALASATGIFSSSYGQPTEFTSIHGQKIELYGKGLYRHMSSDVAIQGIAQDYVTLFLAMPLLLAALIMARRGSLRARFVLAGILNYFLLTYLFYLEIAMFNEFFLVYVLLIGTSFWAFALCLLSFDLEILPSLFNKSTPVKFSGGFLIFTSISVAMMWLGVVVPPLLNGTIYPPELQHYTTLTVQGLDLSIFLPVAFISGLLLLKRNKYGYLLSTVTLVFLSFLMTALVAKIIGMATVGANVVPAIFIIPLIAATSVICSFLMLKNIKIQ